jgi:hypothetical protein
MLDTFLEKYLGKYYFRRGLAIAVLFYTFHLTKWAGSFALLALAKGGDLVGTAGVVTAISAIPLGLLALIFKWYDDKRESDATDN